IQISDGWEDWQRKGAYPETVAQLLGQGIAAGGLLAASLKFEGRLSLQAEGDGPVPMLIVQSDEDLLIRGMARFKGEIGGAPSPALLGKARLALMIEPDSGAQRYEAFVPLEGETLADCLAAYFSQSEQLETRLHLAADGQRLAGILLQKMPAGEADIMEDEDAWPRMSALLETLQDEELLGLDPAELLRRLFHEEDVVIFEQRPAVLQCQCSHARTSSMLLGLGEEEVRQILTEQGQVEMDCGFCGEQYVYQASDIEQLFAAEHAEPESDLRH
ncbi:MAG: Hsp33 family molecular chaperone HslO, partial [Salinisphaeraceae bacterium]|nr:Hsp33 family molecular chaperone HslO [Salinisphaeraceae bacterium]